MILSMEREKLLDSLLNTLEAERHHRGALLLEVIDALDAAGEAAALARRMLQGIESGRMREGDFCVDLARLRHLALGDARASAA
jgi:hypothetical protein